MDVTCEVNELCVHKFERAENVKNIRIKFYRMKYLLANTTAARRLSKKADDDVGNSMHIK